MKRRSADRPSVGNEVTEAVHHAARARRILTDCEREAAALRQELQHAHGVALDQELGDALDWISEFVQIARFELARAERALGSLRSRLGVRQIATAPARRRSR
jgi:hypothetical protein